MIFLVNIFILCMVSYICCEYAGTECTTETIPGSYTTGTTTSTSGGLSFMLQDADYQFTCCGVVSQWKVTTKASGTIFMQIWRQLSETQFQLISQQEFSVANGNQPIDAEDHQKMSFREGDMVGWYSTTADLVRYSSTPGQNNRYAMSRAGTNIGDNFNWNGGTIDVVDNAVFSIQAVTSPTSPPYFKNLPTYILKADTEMTVSGISLLTLTANDPDLADNTSLTISMFPEWTDYFSLDASNLITTSRQLTPGTYLPVFRVEEAHCGVFHTATLTLSVYDSMPSITNLPAASSLHEDVIDETLLYTVTTSDPMNQAIFCEGTWTIGTPPNIPFIVKMISLVPGASTAGIYLIEWPYLDYDTAAQTYELVVKCFDTYENTATGTYSVNIIQNQIPVFTNMGNMVEINATTARIGDTVFVVSATDPDGDQIQYDYSCDPDPAPAPDSQPCPFAVYDNGEVKLKANLLTWNTNKFNLTVTAKANNDTSTSRYLVVYITDQNNDPVFINVNGTTINVNENQPLGTSILMATATDADSDSITYFCDISPVEGYSLFECTSAGLIQTHSTYSINFEALSAPAQTHTMNIYAHDTKEMTMDTLTLVVQSVNEAVRFNQPSYGITIPESDTGASTPVNTYIAVTDPDTGASHTFSMNCGDYDSYFTLTTPAMTVTFAQNYDLDPGYLPDEVPCAVHVTDSEFNDTTTLFIKISYQNDNSPVFVAGTTYTVNVGTDTPVGLFIVSVLATDADRESDTIVNYNINQAALTAAGADVHIQNGDIYAKTNFSALAVGTYTITVDATDGTNTVTATVNLVVTLVTTPTPDASNRYYNFYDDTRNIMWFLFACLTILGLTFAIVLMVYSCCTKRKGPLFGGLWGKIKHCFTIERTPKHQLDRKQRKKPIYGRQHTPTYKHLHAHELLRASPEVLATPDIYGDAHSTRANSSMSAKYGKVRVSQVNLKENSSDDVSKWVRDSAQDTAPSGSQPKSTADTSDTRRRRRRNTSITPLPVSPSVTLPQPSTTDFTTGNGDYLDDDDDFKSERLSIAASRNSTLDDL